MNSEITVMFGASQHSLSYLISRLLQLYTMSLGTNGVNYKVLICFKPESKLLCRMLVELMLPSFTPFHLF